MGLPRHVYDSIRRDVDVPVLCCLHMGLLALKYPGVQTDTISSIFAQENQYKVLKTHHIHKANMDSYCARYLDGVDVLWLCADVDFPPCLLMRRLLETLLGLSRQRVGDLLKQPALNNIDAAAALSMWQQSTGLQQQQQQKPRKQQQQQQQQRHSGSSSSRWDPQQLVQCLQRDIVRCVYADRSYSPYCDMGKSLAGLEHEALLYQSLSAAGVPFWREQELRERGLFKTPDALLQVPVCIKGPDSRCHMVHWIDSKATFGDDRTHNQQMEGQYATYLNRYGPGCVIYWFGFIADLTAAAAAAANRGAGSNTSSSGGGMGVQDEGGEVVQEVDVLLLDRFPAREDILQLPTMGAAAGGAAGPLSSTNGSSHSSSRSWTTSTQHASVTHRVEVV